MVGFNSTNLTLLSTKGVTLMRISLQFAHRFVCIGILGLLIVLLTACGGTGASTNPTSTSNKTPSTGGSKSTSAPSAGKITEFAIPTPGSDPEGITAGRDGNLWFTELAGNQIGRITPTGTVTEFAVPSSGTYPNWITTGPDGNLWFTSYNTIVRFTPTGTITGFQLRTSNSPAGIIAGPDGNLW